MSGSKYFKVFVLIILAFELIYSFAQHYHEPIDGDVAGIALSYEEVLSDPFGKTVIFEGSQHGNPNRYFVHVCMSNYVKYVPLFLQNFFSPLDSIYISFAIFKCLLQGLMIYLLAVYVNSTFGSGKNNFLITVVLIFPLFQMGYLNQYMGIILGSITYTFFYAFPIALLMIIFFPFYKYRDQLNDLPGLFGLAPKTGMLVMMIILAFSGPLIAPLVILISSGILLRLLIDNFNKINEESFFKKIFSALKSIPVQLIAFCVLFILLCLYSFYLGTFNSENISIPISERYQLFLGGLFHQLTRKLGFPILIGFILLNLFILSRLQNSEAKRILKIAKVVFYVSLIYTLLLPLGGYRAYRSDIIRADTFMPVTLGLFYLFASSSKYILQYLKSKKKRFYLFGISACLLFFIISDEPNFTKNKCERNAITVLQQSTEVQVILNQDCNVLTWRKIDDFKQTEKNGELLYYLNIIDRPIMYKHRD